EGRLLLKERLPQSALAPLQSAIQKNPNLPEARGWLAATHYLLGFNAALMNEQLRAIKAPTPSGLHPVTLFEAAEVLRDARQFAQAESLYIQAADAATWWAEPPAALAALYLETGHTDKAQKLYNQAFNIAPYNVRILNRLKLLETLHTFETIESKTRLAMDGGGPGDPIFIIRYEKQDEILAKLALEWMEQIHPEVLSYFNIQQLPTPTIIEFFPSHEQFSVRTIGLPWIGTVGASTGNVIAMDVPRGGAKGMMGAFDWARVLRHEYAHTVTLAMTNNRVPHWLTEAAACEQEQAPRDWQNHQLLWLNYRSGNLFKIANLNWGFIKPRRSTDRQLAYMQSQWLYQYLVATYGLPKMLDFFGAFRDGSTEAQAWEKVYGKSMENMDKEFHIWAGQQIASWGLSTDPLPKRQILLDAIKKDPKDVEALVDLASVEAMAGQGSQARKRLEQVFEIDPGHLRAREFLGAVLSQQKGSGADVERARSLLESVLKDDPKRSLAVRSLGVLAMGRRDYDEAEKRFKDLQSLIPLDISSYTNLAGIYLVRKDYPAAISQLLELQRHEQRDERIPRRLAALFKDQRQLAEAEQSAYRAIRINPYNAINHELMAQVLVEAKQSGRSIEYWSNAVNLQPKVVAFWEGLADAKGNSGDLVGAAEAAKKAIELHPQSSASKWLATPQAQ
ncbi:MAG: tetratricopeptide repeat protein, partial [Phycisphaerales bacterium]|nr:tetratricopeptide repeat protein [Phycisphaerales bacterium]